MKSSMNLVLHWNYVSDGGSSRPPREIGVYGSARIEYRSSVLNQEGLFDVGD